MFHPTHWLVSRTKKTPVQLIPSATGFSLMSQHDVESQSEPSFEIRTRLGIFCRNVPILGYSLEPMPLTQSMLDQAVASTTHPGDRS